MRNRKQPRKINEWQAVAQPNKAVPDWELGFSITLPESGNEIPGWHSDIIAAGQFLAMLSFEFPSEFVIGFVDTRTGISEDLHFVQPADADLNRLRALIDVGEIE